MEAWKQFELDCTNYLQETFGEYASFTHQGFEDSTVADIKVSTKSGRDFCIEAKCCPAQCNQFVLLPNPAIKKFQYSSGNATSINEYSKKIIDYMNSDFESFKEAGTSGKDIVFEGCENVFTNWICDAYNKKKVKYFITNNYRIFKLSELAENFSITAKYRVKRSGSTHVGSSRMNSVKEYIKSNYPSVMKFSDDGKKLFAKSTIDLDKTRFYLGEYEYMFSKRGNEYEIRQLSNTFNANVIFSVTLKTAPSISNEEFISILS